jgi:predicted transposase YbfD/YdcC
MVTSLALLDALTQIPDPRDPRGIRHPLTAVLSLAVLAMMTGVKSYCGIAQFGRDHGAALAHALGFRRGKTPAVSSFSELFRVLDVGAFEAALSRWIASRRPAGAEQVISLDGKTARGSRDGEVPGQHLVAAYDSDARAVLAQIRVDAKTNEHKAALQLLGILPLAGAIFVGDAMFCQRDLCATIVEGGGDYVFFVKDNQPSLDIDIGAGLAYEAQARSQAAAFSPGRCPADRRRTRGVRNEQGARPVREAYAADDFDPDQAAGLGRPEARL